MEYVAPAVIPSVAPTETLAVPQASGAVPADPTENCLTVAVDGTQCAAVSRAASASRALSLWV